MSNLSCGTHVAEPTANIDCRKLLNQSCRFLPKLKLPISADAKLPLTSPYLTPFKELQLRFKVFTIHNSSLPPQQASARTFLGSSRPERLSCSSRRAYIPTAVRRLHNRRSETHNPLLPNLIKPTLPSWERRILHKLVVYSKHLHTHRTSLIDNRRSQRKKQWKLIRQPHLQTKTMLCILC